MTSQSTLRPILVIDDFPEVRSLYAACLARDTELGEHAIWEAGSGKEGLDLVARRVPALILLDYRLPDMDGLEFLRRLRGEGTEGLPCPVILLTGEDLQDQVSEAVSLGIADYFYKGNISPINLCTAVREALRGSDSGKLFRSDPEARFLYWIGDNAEEGKGSPEVKLYRAPILRETDRVIILDRYYPIPDLGYKKLILKNKLPAPLALDPATALELYLQNTADREERLRERIERIEQCRREARDQIELMAEELH